MGIFCFKKNIRLPSKKKLTYTLLLIKKTAKNKKKIIKIKITEK